MNGCNGNCNQGRRVCNCGARFPVVPVHTVDLAYDTVPFPRVARWIDRHPGLASVLAVLFVVGLVVLGGWLDGAPT